MKRLLTCTFGLLCLVGASISAQPQAEKRVLKAERTSQPVRIDGILDEAVWASAQVATGFTQLEPNPGAEPTRSTEVHLVYDDRAIYVGAKMYDNPDDIAKQLFERDNLSNDVRSDWFGVAFDTYMDGINGFAFLVTPAGVQIDIKFTSDGDDDAWDAVWDSEAVIVSDGWVVEMEIPYSALRFPDRPVQEWHLQMARKRFASREEAFWNPVDPEQDGFFNQAGILQGIENVRSPVRLSATPFIAVYGENYYDKHGNPKSTWGRSINGGMDVRYGISDAFTLDMTLIPDFGQVRSDNEVLNLSPFEVRFDENRQFFTEGTELFGKANLFYSRRVGGRPFYYDDVEDDLQEGEEIVDNPRESQLYNATKVSGRTSKGTGLGFFNAVAGNEYAVIRNTETGDERKVLTNPVTNYNVMVVDQNFRNNSYVSLINTSVWRSGSAYEANVTGTEFNFRNKSNRYRLSGIAAVSQKYFSDHTDIGHKYRLEVGKQSGNLVWETGYNVESYDYDPNDLGFINNNNERRWHALAEYNYYEPFGAWNRMGGGLFTRLNYLDKFTGTPEMEVRDNLFTSYGINIWWWGQTRNFLELNVWTYFQPVEAYDYFEPRVDGRFYQIPKYINTGLEVGTDSRKKLSFDLEFRYLASDQEKRHQLGFNVEPSLRLSDKFNLAYVVAAALFVFGLKLLSSPATARARNVFPQPGGP